MLYKKTLWGGSDFQDSPNKSKLKTALSKHLAEILAEML